MRFASDIYKLKASETNTDCAVDLRHSYSLLEDVVELDEVPDGKAIRAEMADVIGR